MKHGVIAWWLVILGAVNWLLVGLGSLLGNANWNLVELVFGSWSPLDSFVYVLIGAAGVWLLWNKTMVKK